MRISTFLRGVSTVSLALSLFAATAAAANATTSPGSSTIALTASTMPAGQSSGDFENTVKEVGRFIVIGANGQRHFDAALAKRNGASAAALEAGDQFNLVASAYQSSATGGGVSTMAGRPGVPVWGNWCGPGHGGGPALGTLDKECRTHDQCYGRRGYFDCKCDGTLVLRLYALQSSMSGRERAVAIAIATYFNSAPCVPRP